MVVGGGINPLQTLSQGPLLTFCKLVGVNQDVREDPELDKNYYTAHTPRLTQGTLIVRCSPPNI